MRDFGLYVSTSDGDEVEDFHTYFVGEYGVLVHNYDLVEKVGDNTFEVTDWTGYPAGAPKPSDPLTVLTGDAYTTARNAANNANKKLHKTFAQWLKDMQIHEILPVKFGGSPTDINNKIALLSTDHNEFNRFWAKILKDIMKG